MTFASRFCVAPLMPTLFVAAAPESPAVSSSVVWLSGRRFDETESRTRKPLPKPVAEASARMSERMAIVVAPFAPVPCPAITLKVAAGTVPSVATPAPAAEPRPSPRMRSVPVAFGAESMLPVAMARFRATPAVPAAFSVMTPPPFCTVSVFTFSVMAAPELPFTTSEPPCIVSVRTVPENAVVAFTFPPRRLLSAPVLLSSVSVPFGFSV